MLSLGSVDAAGPVEWYTFHSFKDSKLSERMLYDMGNINQSDPSVLSGKLYVAQYSFVPVYSINGSVASPLNSLTALAGSVALGVTDKPLIYPNPCRQSSDPFLQYTLSGAGDIQIKLYDMRGNEVSQVAIAGGGMGANQGYNKVLINDLLQGQRLSSGPYFVVMMSQGKVLAKTKFVVMP